MNLEFFFSLSGSYTNEKESSLLYYILIAGGRIVEWIRFPRVLALGEMYQPWPGFELGSPCTFLRVLYITSTCINITLHSLFFLLIVIVTRCGFFLAARNVDLSLKWEWHSPQIFRSLLNILVDLNSAVVWMVFFAPISKSPKLFFRLLGNPFKSINYNCYNRNWCSTAFSVLWLTRIICLYFHFSFHSMIR